MTEVPEYISRHIRDSDEETVGQQEITVRLYSNNVTIGLAGHGLATMEEGFDEVIYVERYEGKVRLLVWADINQEDPTHVIDLSGALETNRVEQHD